LASQVQVFAVYEMTACMRWGQAGAPLTATTEEVLSAFGVFKALTAYPPSPPRTKARSIAASTAIVVEDRVGRRNAGADCIYASLISGVRRLWQWIRCDPPQQFLHMNRNFPGG
jgi:hypothetical protein